ncbi:pentapeptide repeat-containing protein [Yersinia alsatica]|uniref:pentapeptide repeat-containing protein n=1 Tax=Yersinia alsatica TaxID=2890317 RepID=UPI00119D5D1B|nr:pentapeptide repeat-containing protein [Yersinia alsatica]
MAFASINPLNTDRICEFAEHLMGIGTVATKEQMTSPKTILEHILNFFTFGSVRKEAAEQYDKFVQAMTTALCLHNQARGDNSYRLPDNLTVDFAGHTVTFTLPGENPNTTGKVMVVVSRSGETIDSTIDANIFSRTTSALLLLDYLNLVQLSTPLMDGKGVSLPKVNLAEAKLTEINLSGAILREANLSNAKLSSANLSEADLTGAKLIEAKLAEINLSGAILRGAALLRADLSSANLSKADLTEAKLQNTDLRKANLYRAKLNQADLRLAQLQEACMTGAELSGANLDSAKLFKAQLSTAQLGGANLSDAHLYRADLSHADLSHARLNLAELAEAKLNGANLNQADLYGANLRAAELGGANLCGANLHRADLREANLYGADLRGANLHGVDLSTVNLNGANLSGAKLDHQLGSKSSPLMLPDWKIPGALGHYLNHLNKPNSGSLLTMIDSIDDSFTEIKVRMVRQLMLTLKASGANLASVRESLIATLGSAKYLINQQDITDWLTTMKLKSHN